MCHVDQITTEKLFAHKLECIHNSQQPLVHWCPFCGVKFPNQVELKEHVDQCRKMVNAEPKISDLKPIE